MSNQKLSKNLKKLCEKKDFSQDRLSKLADISYNTVIKMKSGRITNLTIETLLKLTKAIGVSFDKLLNLHK